MRAKEWLAANGYHAALKYDNGGLYSDKMEQYAVSENAVLREALESIHRRFVAADTGSLHIRDGVAWAMDSDARAALARAGAAQKGEV